MKSCTVRGRIFPFFWDNVEFTDTCWNWKQAHEKYYGNFNGVKPAKITYTYAYGPFPEGMLLLHKCDNKRCIKPSHLYAGTHKDNMRDVVERNHPSTRTKPRKRIQKTIPENYRTTKYRRNDYRAVQRRLDEDIRSQIRRLNSEGVELENLSCVFGIHRDEVRRIILSRN